MKVYTHADVHILTLDDDIDMCGGGEIVVTVVAECPAQSGCQCGADTRGERTWDHVLAGGDQDP